MIIEIIVGVVLLVGGFVAGVLVGRKNVKTVNTVVADTKTAAADVVSTAKKV